MNAIATALLWFTYFVSLYFAIFWLVIFLTKKDKPTRKKLTKFPFVSIVVPAYNEEERIGPTIEAALELDYPKDKFEIIAVDDGSADNTSAVVKQVQKKHSSFDIKLIRQENKGKGAALNHALKKAKGEYFICLDADSFVEKDALKIILPYFTDEKVAAVLPALKVKNPKNTLQKLQWYEYIINMFYKELMGKLDCVHVTPGPFSVYSKKLLQEVGGFDEDNITEDLEIAFRFQANNYKIIQLLETNVLTLCPTNIKDLYKQRNRWFKGATLNAIAYRKMIFNKKYGDFGMIQVPTVILSGIIAVIMIASIGYYTLKPHVVYLYNLSFVNFDIWTILKALTFDFKWVDLDFITLFVALVMISVSIFIMKKSQVSSNEKLMKYGTVSVLSYLLFYFLLLGVFWFGVLFDIATGRRQKW